MRIKHILTLMIYVACVSCGMEVIVPDQTTDEEETRYPTAPQMTDDLLPQDAAGSVISDYKADRGACVLDLCLADKEDESSSSTGRNLYSAEYMMEVAGLPSFTTSDFSKALADSRLILASSVIKNSTFSPEQIDALCSWVADGGILMAPAVTATNKKITELFGTTSSTYGKSRKRIIWSRSALSAHECSYFDTEQEHVISLADGKGKHEDGESIKTYGYTISDDATCLATFESDEVAVVKNRYGNGTAYTFGLLWRDVVARPQMGKTFNASRGSWDSFETSYDAFPLFLRCLWSLDMPSASKFTIPNGWQGMLIPTHDCDSKTAYEQMHWMSDYEASLGVSCHYFMTVHYFRDSGYLSDFYTGDAIPQTDSLLMAGHTLGSHSICHFPDFDITQRFPMTVVSREDYSPHHDKETGITTGGSTWAEVVLSKNIIEEEQKCSVKSFRPGHMCHNKLLAEALTIGNYKYASASQANTVLASFPFLKRAGQDWTGDITNILEIPLHFSDVLHNDDTMNEDTWNEVAQKWVDIIAKQTANYSPSVLLIHPNREYKMLAEKYLVDKMNNKTIGICNFEYYGDFWNRRRDFTFSTRYDRESGNMYIQATSKMISDNAGLPILIEFNGKDKGASAPTSVTVIDENNTVYSTHRIKISKCRYLVIL